jgi:hypothetical protein
MNLRPSWWPPKPLIQWWEPLAFQRRRVSREAIRYRWAFLRWMLYGLVLTTLAHWVVARWNLSMVPISGLYVAGVLLLPGMLLLSMLLQMCVPRLIVVYPNRLAMQSGQQASSVNADQILDYRFCTCGQQAVLMMIRRRRDGSLDRLTIGVSPKIDLLRLDDSLQQVVMCKREAVSPQAVAAAQITRVSSR